MLLIGLIGLALTPTVAATAPSAPPERSFGWRVNGEAAAPSPSKASKYGFGVQMMLTDDYDGFWKAWEGSSPPHVSVADRIERGKPVHAMLVFSGCKAAPNGNCNVTADYAITAPNGTPYGEPMSGPVWKLPPAPDYILQLSEGSIALLVEPGEMLGRYQLKATVTDHVAGLTVAVEAPVDVVEAAARPKS